MSTHPHHTHHATVSEGAGRQGKAHLSLVSPSVRYSSEWKLSKPDCVVLSTRRSLMPALTNTPQHNTTQHNTHQVPWLAHGKEMRVESLPANLPAHLS
jgi:hypothetical protein